jgi:hypothetical protein
MATYNLVLNKIISLGTEQGPIPATLKSQDPIQEVIAFGQKTREIPETLESPVIQEAVIERMTILKMRMKCGLCIQTENLIHPHRRLEAKAMNF